MNAKRNRRMLKRSWKPIAMSVPKKLATRIIEHILSVLERMAIGMQDKKIESLFILVQFIK